jgi:hypothetical protein
MQAETRHVWFQQTFLLIKIAQLQKKKKDDAFEYHCTHSFPTNGGINYTEDTRFSQRRVEDQSGNLLIQDAAPLHLGSCSPSLLFIDYPTHADATAESLPFNATVLLRSPVALSGGDTCGLGPADHGATAVMNSSDSDLDLLPLPHATHARKKEKKKPKENDASSRTRPSRQKQSLLLNPAASPWP